MHYRPTDSAGMLLHPDIEYLKGDTHAVWETL